MSVSGHQQEDNEATLDESDAPLADLDAPLADLDRAVADRSVDPVASRSLARRSIVSTKLGPAIPKRPAERTMKWRLLAAAVASSPASLVRP